MTRADPKATTKRDAAEAVRAIAAKITERGRFAFFFAGNGKTRRAESVYVAYLVVIDRRDRNEPASLISTGDIGAYSHSLDKARHQLSVFGSY